MILHWLYGIVLALDYQEQGAVNMERFPLLASCFHSESMCDN